MSNVTTRDADLVDVLTELGVDVRKVQNDEINGRCPVHRKVKGRESSRYSWYMNVDTGLWHCFTCGARGNLSQLVSDLSGDPGTLWKVQRHLITSGIHRLTAEESVLYEYEPEVDWATYYKFLPPSDGLLRLRKLTRESADRYGIKWDPEDKATVLPIVSPLGELRGWQAKKVGWVKNTPTGVHKHTTLFGIERAYEPIGVLVESPLDVVRFHSVPGVQGYSCVSSFGANVSDAQIMLLSQRFEGVIIALDNDKAGAHETRRLTKLLPSFRKGVRYWKYGPSDPKDIGEMEDDQLLAGLKSTSKVY